MAQLEGLVAHYEELQEMMADPEVINDTKRYMEISKEEADLREVVQKYKKYICAVMVDIDEQSPDIAGGVDHSLETRENKKGPRLLTNW